MYLTSHQWDLLRAIAEAPRVSGTMVWVQASNELQLFLAGRPLLATGLAATWFDIAVLSSEGLVQRIAGGGSNIGLRVGPKGIAALDGRLAAEQQSAATAPVQTAGAQPAATALAKAAGAQPVVFIGHGRAKDWLELDRYLREDLNLAVEEFNRTPAPGIPIHERITEMLDRAKFAFLVLTAEDAHSDESLHPRANVIHEVGLFQGKLGARKAIMLVEREKTQLFSNVAGLGHIEFSAGEIKGAFYDVQQVLRREKVIP